MFDPLDRWAAVRLARPHVSRQALTRVRPFSFQSRVPSGGRRPEQRALPSFSSRDVVRGSGAGLGLDPGLPDAPSAGQKGGCRASPLPSASVLGGRPHGTVLFAAQRLCWSSFGRFRQGMGLGAAAAPWDCPPRARSWGVGTRVVCLRLLLYRRACSRVPSPPPVGSYTSPPRDSTAKPRRRAAPREVLPLR